jgi:hypothetical protein
VLDGAHRQGPADAGPPTEQPEDAEVDRGGARGGERHLVGSDLESLGHGRARVVEQQPGLTGGGVQPQRVGVPGSPGRVVGSEQRLARGGVERLGGTGVQVAAHVLGGIGYLAGV